MSDEDLKKKQEGTFVTGLPEISSDPLTGFGVGVSANIFWNGQKDNDLFEYTPYLRSLQLDASYFTSNARELTLSLDIPYINASRWRLIIEAGYQQNPTNLYFGITDNTLNNLSFPNDKSGKTYKTYREYESAKNQIRPGVEGEAAFVTDDLINTFKETEYLLNIIGEYSIGSGEWRLLLGYEVQDIRYNTFQGTKTDAIDPNTNKSKSTVNGKSLLEDNLVQSRIIGLSGGWQSIIQAAIIYDTRDFEPDPTSGHYFEVTNEFSNGIIGSQYNFDKLFIQYKAFQKLPLGPRTILAARVGYGNTLGSKAPFFEYIDQWSPDGTVKALGGGRSLRGYLSNRFLARNVIFMNAELRVRLLETEFLNQQFDFGLAPFFDMGTVGNTLSRLNLDRVKYSYGCGLRIAWNQSTIISLDYGISVENNLFYFGIGQIF